ncbi:glycosyltransferase [Sabulilitoribacter arenilitoris]|uniref:Glycosyltransferase n=1 Tax=Wocania arenilitoris TaxID=2044858 RepID=A0AAE3JM41_9FLAO|nr:glycosyltransferase [Wocania arenilitoris]MCF7568974.1 glycosyltransferase [Wocania arenilitoris]
MRFLIISHTIHKEQGNLLYAYAPYVREMNIWLKHVNKVEIIAPKTLENVSEINLAYRHDNIYFNHIPTISFTSIKNTLKSLILIPKILFKIFKACENADHIHLRCPGNIGLLGCLVQIFFPKKIKTAKYAGNWNPDSKQPLSYRFQKWILSNTFFTKNMQVLVYGNWKNQTKNIKSFFTASYYDSEIEKPLERDYYNKLNFIFVGSLVKGKRPLLAIKIIELLKKEGKNVSFELFGDGVLKEKLQDYITINKLDDVITLKGNQKKEVIKKALKKAHFLILPSKSEGWPKAIAEAMFFGTIPIATKISCIPFMLDYGNRGILIEPNCDAATLTILKNLKTSNLKGMSKLASNWSQNYTLDVFETEVIKLLNK